MRPYFCDVEWVEPVGLRLFGSHDLDLKLPRWKFSLLDGIVQVAGRHVRIYAAHPLRFLARKILNPLFCLEVELDPVMLAFCVVPHISVAAVAVHIAIRFWRAAIRKENCYLMKRLRRQRQKIPEHVGILKIGAGMAFLRMNEVRKLQRIADEEDRRVVPDHVGNCLLRYRT